MVIQHVDRLDNGRLGALSRLLEQARGSAEATWVAVTLNQRHDGGELADLLRFFPSTAEVPPLRHHVEDVQALVPHVLSRLVPGGGPVCSPEALQLLVRSTWPGNTRQLWEVLRQIVQHRRGGTIQPVDLPPECRTVSRRMLSPPEAMEHDAIVRSLNDWGRQQRSRRRAPRSTARFTSTA